MIIKLKIKINHLQYYPYPYEKNYKRFKNPIKETNIECIS